MRVLTGKQLHPINNRIRTKLAALTFMTMLTEIKIVYPSHKLLYVSTIIKDEARFKIHARFASITIALV